MKKNVYAIMNANATHSIQLIIVNLYTCSSFVVLLEDRLVEKQTSILVDDLLQSNNIYLSKYDYDFSILNLSLFNISNTPT